MHQQSHIHLCPISIVSNETLSLIITLKIDAESARNNDTPSCNWLFPVEYEMLATTSVLIFAGTEDDI